MSTPAKPLATCILSWIYEQAAALLKMLKQALMALLTWIDLQIAKLRAILTQWDILANLEAAAWALVEAAVAALKDALTSFPEGPWAAFCPEFYTYLVDPAIGLLDANMAALSAVRGKYKSYVSAVYYFERQIAYWEQIKADYIHLIDVIDDAIHHALLVGAAEAVP